MPAAVNISEAQAQIALSTDIDFAMCLIGYSTSSAVSAGQVSPMYGSPAAAVADLGLSDCVDALCHAITKTQGNTAPPPAAHYKTPATTGGVRGGTLTVSGVTGTSVVTKTSATNPIGTFQPVGRVITGGTIGVAGIILQFSLDNGRTWLPQVALGTATTKKIQISVNGSLVDTGVQYDFAAGTLVTGDTWSESKTTPPMWGTSDLYAAGPPAAGAFAAIAESDKNFGILVITEPVQASDFATLVAGLNYGLSMGKRWLLMVRFRDPTSGETDAAYITAFQTFAAANQDDRICPVAGSGWLTDAFRGFVHLRSGLPAVLARLQSNAVVPGSEGEKIAQHPGYVQRGPLEGFSVTDTSGNQVGHDEQIRGGIDGPVGSTGGGLTFFRIPGDLPGTYVSDASVLYPAPNRGILTLMDRRVANGIERVASAIAWLEIQGAAIFDPETLALDDSKRDAIQTKIAKAIRDRYRNEFQNPDDPNLVEVNPTVMVNGARVTISGTLNVRFYGYIHTINLSFSATR